MMGCFSYASTQTNKHFLYGPIALFVSGTEGHQTYRIPAVIITPKGNLITFCEGRVKGSGDFGDINIVSKRSHDGGITWSVIQTVVDYDTLQAGNPAPVVDLTDPLYPQGRIFLFYNTGNNQENEIRKGKGLREVWYKTSTDEGTSWSNAVNITAQTHKPYQILIIPNYAFKEDWRSYANTPGHALQISNGKYKGRYTLQPIILKVNQNQNLKIIMLMDFTVMIMDVRSI